MRKIKRGVKLGFGDNFKYVVSESYVERYVGGRLKIDVFIVVDYYGSGELEPEYTQSEKSDYYVHYFKTKKEVQDYLYELVGNEKITDFDDYTNEGFVI